MPLHQLIAAGGGFPAPASAPTPRACQARASTSRLAAVLPTPDAGTAQQSPAAQATPLRARARRGHRQESLSALPPGSDALQAVTATEAPACSALQGNPGRMQAAHRQCSSSSRRSMRAAPKYGTTFSAGHQRASSRCQFSSRLAGATMMCGPASPSSSRSAPARSPRHRMLAADSGGTSKGSPQASEHCLRHFLEQHCVPPGDGHRP